MWYSLGLGSSAKAKSQLLVIYTLLLLIGERLLVVRIVDLSLHYCRKCVGAQHG